MLNYKLFAVLAIVLASGIFYGEAFAIGVNQEYTPTQTNAYASYNNSTNQVQVSWNFNTMTAGDKCVIKMDVQYQARATDDEVPPVETSHYIPNYYSAISSSPVLLGNGPSYQEEVECKAASFRIDLATILNSSVNPDSLTDLLLFLTFYATDDVTSPSLNNDDRIDEVFVVYSPNAALVDGGANDQIQWSCDSQIGSVLYIDQSGSGNTIIAHGNNGDNCTEYVYIENNQYVDIGMDGAVAPLLPDGNISKGNHVADDFSLLYQVVTQIIALLTSNGGDDNADSRPSFGVDHKRFTQLVDEGLVINDIVYLVDDNFHTDMKMVPLRIGQIHNFTSTVYAPHALKYMEFGFGIPDTGKWDEREASIEIEINYSGEIIGENVEEHTDSPIINATSLVYSISDVKCNAQSNTETCKRVSVEFSFSEAPIEKVFALKAIDQDRMSNITYFNDGITLEGDSQNPPTVQQIMSEIKYKGLQTIQRIDKENDIWMTLDKSEPVLLYKQNDFGTFIPIEYRTFEQTPDEVQMNMDRLNSQFKNLLEYEINRATNQFDARQFDGEISPSWSHDYPTPDRMAENNDAIESEKKRTLEAFEKIYQDNEKATSNH